MFTSVLSALQAAARCIAARPSPTRARRKHSARIPIAAEVLECRSLLTSSITSLYLLNDTGTAGDNVTSDATIAGTVSDPSKWQEIQLDIDGDGVPDRTAYPDEDGYFEFSGTDPIPPAEENTYRARTLVYGAAASETYSGWFEITFTYNPAPRITSFVAIEQEDNLWTFTGYVEDNDNPGTLLIDFGGLLEGQTVIVEFDGSFTLSVYLDPGDCGLVTAQTTDEYGEVSNLAETWISPF